MTTFWQRIHSLEERTLQSAARGKAFDIIEVTHNRIIFVPQDGKQKPRWYARKDMEMLFELRINKGSLETRDIRALFPQDRNTSYIPVIINEVYDLGNQ